MLANGFTTGAVALLLAGAQLAAAHMEISYPAPFRSKYNKYATNIDYTNTAPLEASGANYPCKGYQSDLGTAAGTATASFAAGSQYQFTVVGGAPHGGGSCQVSLSYDKGKTFTVIQSIEGGCPLQSNYTFTVPSDAPTGDAIWAWTWNNEIGNREFYMNCAAVTITGSGSSKRAAELDTRATAFSARPQVFVANLANINTCTVAEGTDVKYPNPGPDVTTSGSKIGAPAGSCGSASSGSSGSSSGSSSSGSSSSGSGAASSSVQATAAPAATSTGLPGGVFLTVASSATSSAAAAAAPTTLATSVASANTPASTGTSSSGSSSSSSGSSSSSSGSSSSAGAYAAGTACSDEGAWNCIAGTSFQRCASGTWSAVQSVAPGTKCAAGVSDSYTVEVATKLRARRLRGSEKRRITADA